MSNIRTVVAKATVQAVLTVGFGTAFVVGFLVTKQISGEAFVGAVMLTLNHFFRQSPDTAK